MSNLIVADDDFPDEALNGFDDWERYEEMESDSQGHWPPSESLNNHNSKSTQTHLVRNNVDWDASKKRLQKHPPGGRLLKEDTEGYDPPLSATPTHSPEVPVSSTRAISIQTLSEKELEELEELMRLA